MTDKERKAWYADQVLLAITSLTLCVSTLFGAHQFLMNRKLHSEIRWAVAELRSGSLSPQGVANRLEQKAIESPR